MKPLTSHDPASTYLHLATGPETTIVPVDETFWSTIDERTELHSGRLLTGLAMAEDWSVWEMHPAGDELIAVTSGTVHFHLDDGVTTSELTVTAPEYIVVPAGTWHTADGRGDARLLIVTWGAGTRHRPR